MIKKIAGNIYALYILIVFVLTMLVIEIPVWIISKLPEPQRAKSLHLVFRIWIGAYMLLIFCPVKRRGKQNFKKGENYVVVINHCSLLDIPVSSPWIPGPNKTLGRIEFSKIPLFGLIYETGAIIVDRKSDSSRSSSMRLMLNTLRQGIHLCLYPEGTRNKTNDPIQPFYDGAFLIAIRAQKPVIPALMFNTAKILPMDRKFWARPGTVHFHFLTPIETKGLTLADVGNLKDRVHKLMTDYYTSHLKELA